MRFLCGRRGKSPESRPAIDQPTSELNAGAWFAPALHLLERQMSGRGPHHKGEPRGRDAGPNVARIASEPAARDGPRIVDDDRQTGNNVAE